MKIIILFNFTSFPASHILYRIQQDERDQISRVEDGLFLTNFRGAERKEELIEKGITHVVNVNGGNKIPSA